MGVPQGEQMGEGWSDFLALMLTARSSDTATTARGMGNYVVFEGPNGVGIRPTPYTTDLSVNPATYQDVIDDAGTTLTIPHGVGYVWASTIWEVYWNLVDEHGFNPDIYGSWDTGGNNLALQLVIDGMKFQPCHPGFVDGRDGILQADKALTGGENECLLWEGFAKRGLGFSAKQGSSQEDRRRDGRLRPAAEVRRRSGRGGADRAHRPGHRHRSGASPAATPMDAPRFGARPLTSV